MSESSFDSQYLLTFIVGFSMGIFCKSVIPKITNTYRSYRDKVVKLYGAYQFLKNIKPQEIEHDEHGNIHLPFDNHNMVIPHFKEHERKMSEYRVYLVRDGKHTDITHKPGVPYVYSAAQLRGDKILVQSIFDDDEKYEYIEAPIFATEITGC